MSVKKIGIVGAGSVGRIFSYFAAQAGIDLAVYTESQATVKAISKVLKVNIDNMTQEVQVNISSNPAILSDCGMILFCVKTYSTDQAVNDIKDLISKDSIVVSLQNGIGNKEILSQHIQFGRIVYGSTSIGATKIGDDSVCLGGMGNIIIGGQNAAAVKAVEDIFKLMKLDVSVTDNPDEAVWRKTIINAGINPIGALLNIPNGQIVTNDYTLKLQENIVCEAVEVAAALGQSFAFDEMLNLTRSVCQKTSKNLCSMLQDVSSKSRTEIDNINGKIIEYGAANKISAPYNTAVYYLIKAKESL